MMKSRENNPQAAACCYNITQRFKVLKAVPLRRLFRRARNRCDANLFVNHIAFVIKLAPFGPVGAFPYALSALQPDVCDAGQCQNENIFNKSCHSFPNLSSGVFILSYFLFKRSKTSLAFNRPLPSRPKIIGKRTPSSPHPPSPCADILTVKYIDGKK